MNCKIDIDKFIASLIKRQKAYNNNDFAVELENILCEQGLIYEDGEIIDVNPSFKPEKGKWYMCIKTVVMTSGGETAYKKGKIYKSEIDNCITDEQGISNHCWYSKYDREHELYKYFRPATEKEILRLAPLTDEQRAYIEEGLKNGSIIREKDLAYAEPKFKIGDWLVNKKQVGEAFCITQINKPHYYSTNLGSFIKFGEEENYRKWTIKDAKPGDVLVYEGYYNSIVLFHGIGLNGEGHINYYCKCDLADYDVNIQGDVAYMGDVEECAKYYHPATKEQRDLLFQKIEEAGYTWNQDKLDLEKIDKLDIAYINGAISSEDEQGIDKSSCTSTKENNKPQTIKFNESEDTDSVWPKEVVDELLEETQKYTPKIKEELRKYFANIFPYLYNVDVEKMTKDYVSGLLHCGYVGPSFFDRQIAYKRGIEDILKLIKEGGSNESID